MKLQILCSRVPELEEAFSWQYSAKLPLARAASSCWERFNIDVSVTTWLICTFRWTGIWGCDGLASSKVMSFPPNWSQKCFDTIQPNTIQCYLREFQDRMYDNCKPTPKVAPTGLLSHFGAFFSAMPFLACSWGCCCGTAPNGPPGKESAILLAGDAGVSSSPPIRL